MSQIPLYTNPAARFSCTLCGRCCRGWEIALTQQDAARFDNPAAEWAGRGKGRPLAMVYPQSENHSVAVVNRETTAGGACPMLDADNLCHITRAHGWQDTPGICQIFPYRYTRTPDGLQVSLSYGCEAVIDNVGAPMSEQTDSIRQAYAISLPYVAEDLTPDNIVAAERACVLPNDAILTWQAYMVFEEICVVILADAAPIQARLEKLLAVVYALAAHDDLTPDGLRGWWAASPDLALAPDIRDALTATTFLAPLAFLDHADDADAAAESLMEGAGAITLRVGARPMTVDVAAHAATHMQSDAQRFADDLLARYSVDWLLAKNLCLLPAAGAAVWVLHTYAAMLVWLARSYSTNVGKDAATIGDVREAAVALERWGETLANYAIASAIV